MIEIRLRVHDGGVEGGGGTPCLNDIKFGLKCQNVKLKQKCQKQ